MKSFDNSNINYLAFKFEAQRSKIEELVQNGVDPDDLEDLLQLREYVITLRDDIQGHQEHLMKYEQLLDLYILCRKYEGENWSDLAERIVEYALDHDDGDPEQIGNYGHWNVIQEVIETFKKVNYRMFV